VTSPYELDIANQPQALLSLSKNTWPKGLESVFAREYSRIVITGMGTSHFAGHSTWRTLMNHGFLAWWIDTSQLLDMPNVINDETLLIVTSQSGRSGEIVALLDQLRDSACTIVGIVNDKASPLTELAKVSVDMCVGDEATVSTKSYLNSLVIHAELTERLLTGKGDNVRESIESLSENLDVWLQSPNSLSLDALGLERAPNTIAIIGGGGQTATVLTGALIIKEAAKVQAEAYLGGEFRHGPIELSGPRLTAIVIDDGNTESDLRRLSQDLKDSGTAVAVINETNGLPPSSECWGLSAQFFATVALQRFSVELAYANDITPGVFLFGHKITEDV